jgi:hypothetical protein
MRSARRRSSLARAGFDTVVDARLTSAHFGWWPTLVAAPAAEGSRGNARALSVFRCPFLEDIAMRQDTHSSGAQSGRAVPFAGGRNARVARCALFAATAALGSLGIAAQSEARLTGFGQRIDRLEARLAQSESIRSIKRLQHAYGHYAEFGLWHDLADLFADDAVGHYPAGDLVGKPAIARLFLEEVGQGKLGLADGRLYPHLVLQPVVTLDADGRHARGRWHVLAMLGSYGGSASWVGGIYENDYVREDGVWKISELRYFTQFSGRYDGGWTNPRVPAAAAPATGGAASVPGRAPEAPAALQICENYLLNACTIPFHYDAQGAGAPPPAPPIVAETRSADPEPDVGSLRERTGELERRVARLGDESAVANLQHAYGYYVDRKLWDDVADLFAEDATLELGLQGVYAGRASIRRALEQFGAAGLRDGELNDHLQLQTIVTIAPDGNSARARGVDLAQWGARVEDEYRAQWREAIYENAYIKENGVWKIAAMHLFPRVATDYSQGWAKQADAAPAPSPEFPPDRPPTVMHGVYPQFYVPPFGFAHPVTGRPPQYPQGMGAGLPDSGEPASARTVGALRGARALAALEARVAAAERALDVASSHDAVENVANAYSYYLDEFRWDDAAALFAENGWKELPYVGIYRGRERIRASMNMLYPTGGRPAGFFAIHQTMQPVVHIAADGASAKIRLRVLQPRGRIGADGSWIAGVYENEAVLEHGIWKLSAMDLDYTWAAGYREGWAGAARAGVAAESRDALPSGALQPDEPLRGPAGAPFPQIVDLPFHYDNPVSGRAPAPASRRAAAR